VSRRIPPDVCTPVDACENATSPTADMSSPRDDGHDIQTCEAGATSQPAESASHGFSRGHSTGLESMGTGTSNLRQRATELASPVSRPEVSGSPPQEHPKRAKGNDSAPCSKFPLQVGSQVDLKALFNARGKTIKQIDLIVDFVEWISKSDFLRLQLPEPVIGDPSINCPSAMEEQGIKGQSVYTALFHHLDMETFSCKLCPHVVKDDLELSILHQRLHFDHYPYQCLTTQTKWYVPFLLSCGSVSSIHSDSAGSALQIKRGWRNTSSL